MPWPWNQESASTGRSRACVAGFLMSQKVSRIICKRRWVSFSRWGLCAGFRSQISDMMN